MKPCRNCARVARSALLILAGFALLGIGDRPAAGQAREMSFDQIAPDVKKRPLQIEVGKMLQYGKFDAGQSAKFDDYYTYFNLPQWTLSDSRSQLLDLRKKLHDDLNKAGRPSNTEVHDRLNALSLEFMDALANNRDPAGGGGKRFHPAVRVNAMLMIAELNAVERKGSTPPEPLPDALRTLMKNAGDPKQIEAVKVAALVGILRHLTLGAVSEPEQKQLAAVMLKLLKSPSPEGQSAEGHAWLQTRAAEVLGRFGSVGAGGEVAVALAALVGDKKAPFESRCLAAGELGRLKYTKGSYVGDCAVALGRLARDCAAAEIAICSIDRLKWRLGCILAGLNALLPVADDAQRPVGPRRQGRD